MQSHFRRSRAALVAVLLATTALGGTLAKIGVARADWGQQITATTGQAGFATLIDKARPAVVSVLVRQDGSAAVPDQQLPEGLRKFFEQYSMPRGSGQDFRQSDSQRGQGVPQQTNVAQGSGFFVSADGYVVTNNHVVDNAAAISVKLNDGRELKAKLIGTDSKTDIAVIKVDGDKFPFVTFGNSDNAHVGDWVVAVGNPFGLGGTATAGIISARGRDIGSGPYDDFLQIDASINKGNSGGPTFDTTGEVIGINTAIVSPSGGSVGIGFAIPANLARKVVDNLIHDGTVHRGWLGVSIQGVTQDLADSLGLAGTNGALVASVTEGSPAQKAGLVPGDVITDIDGRAIRTPHDLSRLIADKGPNAKAAITLWRNGRPLDINLALVEMPGTKVAADRSDGDLSRGGLGLLLRDSENGVAVAEVRPNSPADHQGIKPGDVIVQVAGKDVKTALDVRQAVENVTDQTKGRVLMLLKTADGNRFVALDTRGKTG